MPFIYKGFSVSILFSIISVLILIFAAGITTPRKKESLGIDIVISVGGFIAFAYRAASTYDGSFDILFFRNLSLAGIFLTVIYLGIKSLRGARPKVTVPNAETLNKMAKSVIDPLHEKEPEKPAVAFDNENKPNLESEEDRRKERFLGEEGL